MAFVYNFLSDDTYIRDSTCYVQCHNGDFCHQGRDTEIVQNILRLSKPTDMTIHWKGLGKHFLILITKKGVNLSSCVLAKPKQLLSIIICLFKR
jgi:hypothetical protein